jgi:hypothetical protein
MAEVIGSSHDGVALEEIFRFDRNSGEFIPTGYRPVFLKRLQAAGVEISGETFEVAT